MSQFSIGDKVQYDNKDYTIVGWNDILEEHELQGADESDTVTVAEDLIVAEGAAGSVGISNLEKPAHKKGFSTPAGHSSLTGKPVHATHKEPAGGPAAFMKTKNNTAATGEEPVKHPETDHRHTADPGAVKKFASALGGNSRGGSRAVVAKAAAKQAASDQAAAEKKASEDAAQKKREKFARRRMFRNSVEVDDNAELTENTGSEELPQDNEQLVEDKKLLDETAASDTIKAKPSAASGVMSSSMVKDVIQAVAGMSRGDQVDFYNKMMDQYGKGKSHGAPEKAGSNKASINAKPSHAKSFKVDSTSQLPSVQIVKDDLQHILDAEDSETFSEEFKAKIATLFEAAVNLRVHEEVSVVREELQEQFDTEVEDAVEALTEHVDSYLSHVAGEWVKENEVEIENSLQMQLSNSFMEGLKELFSEHYMNVPEEKVDIVSALADRIEELEEGMNEQLKTNVELVETLQEYNAEEIFDELCEGLALTQIEKFRKLSEGLDYEGNEEEYRGKLAVIREQYFSVKPTETTLHEEVDVEDDEELNEETQIDMDQDPNVLRYAQTISRTLKR